MRTSGSPSASTVATAMAFGSRGSLASASAIQASNSASGSSASVKSLGINACTVDPYPGSEPAGDGVSTRTVRRFADRVAQHVGPAPPLGQRCAARGWSGARPRPRPARAPSTGACSLSVPMASLKPDDLATGTIDRSAAMLSPALDREDWRRARAALAVTLDPQGNGERANLAEPAIRRPRSFHGARAAVPRSGPRLP